MKSITLSGITYIQVLDNDEIELGLRDDSCEIHHGIINNIIVEPDNDTFIVTFDVPDK